MAYIGVYRIQFYYMKIAIISDTHSWLDDRILNYLKNADEIWHAGDIGSIEVIEKLEQLSGNCGWSMVILMISEFSLLPLNINLLQLKTIMF